MLRRAQLILSALVLALLFTLPAYAGNADSFIVVDAGSGRVLNAMNPDQQFYPASMTKIMTLYLTFEALTQGRLTLKTPLAVSEYAASQAPSKLGLRPGQSITVENAILGVVTVSANDAAVVLAEAIGGSAEQFAEIMTSRAHALGMTNTHFNNPNGLPDDGQLSSARDMATLAEAMIQRFPKFYPYFSTRSFVYAGHERVNHNHLMSRYPGMDGIKTGFIRASGFNLTASALRGGRRLIAVVFGGSSAVARDNYMAGLLDDGFRRAAGLPVTGASQQTVVASAAPPIPDMKPPEPGAPTAPAAAASDTMALEVAREDKTGHEIKEGEIDGVKLSEAAGPQAATQTLGARVPAPASPAGSQIAVNEADLALDNAGPAATEGEGDIAEAPAPPAPHPLSHIHRIVLHAPQKQTGNGAASTEKWGVQIGTFSNKAASDAQLQKAALRLPGGVKEKAAPTSVPLRYRRKQVFRAEFTGLSELEAKRACSVLTHCLTVKPAA